MFDWAKAMIDAYYKYNDQFRKPGEESCDRDGFDEEILLYHVFEHDPDECLVVVDASVEEDQLAIILTAWFNGTDIRWMNAEVDGQNGLVVKDGEICHN